MTEPQRNQRSAEAARRVFLELFELLKPYGLGVLVGGLIPGLEYNDAREPHQGTLDVDLVLSRDGAGAQPDLALLLTQHGYYKDPDPSAFPFQYLRKVKGYAAPVKVDLLTHRSHGESEHPVSTHGVRAFPLLGGELAIQQAHTRSFKGKLPDGKPVDVEARIAGIVPFVVLKAFAIRDREVHKEKDPYDLYYCVRHYPAGLEALLKEFEPFLSLSVVHQAGSILEKSFETPKSFGPASVARAAPYFSGADPDQLALDASERILKLAHHMRAGCAPTHPTQP